MNSRWIAPLFVCLLAACEADPADETTPGKAPGEALADPSTLVGKAFDIQLVSAEYGSCRGDCLPATALVTKADHSSIELLWGATGRVYPVLLTPSGSSWQQQGPLTLGREWRGAGARQEDDTTLSSAIFSFDQGGALSITGKQSWLAWSDDVANPKSSNIALRGTADSRSPKAIGNSDGFDPVHGVFVRMDKPLEGSATATLKHPGGDPVQLTPTIAEGLVVGFTSPFVLPLGVTSTVEFTGKDFAGISTPASLPLTTMDDFGVLAQDGFESGSTSGMHGATVVESWGVPAIAGQRMAQVTGDFALFHLQRKGTEGKLAMTMRRTSPCSQSGSFWYAVAVVGGTKVVTDLIPLGANPQQVPAGESQVTIGDPQLLTIPLTDPGQDVLVWLKGRSDFNCGEQGALIDDLKLE